MDQILDTLRAWLTRVDIGLGLLLVVGLSMSLSHVFALLANRFNGRRILLHLLLDTLILSVAFLLSILIDMLLLTQFASRPIQANLLLDGTGACLLPAIFYVFVAAPYVGDLIALVIWMLVHLNTITLLHGRFELPYGEALLLATPGFALALMLVWILFRQSWRSSYAMLSSQLGDE